MSVSVSDDLLRIDGFETRERDIVDYFNRLPDSDVEKKLVTLLKQGILAQGSVGTALDAKYVETAFDRLRDRFDQRMNDIFEPNGTIASMLAEHFGQDGRIVKDIFNPDTEGTPLNRLKAALHVDLTDIRDKIAERKGQETEARRGTQKGVKFEDFCRPYIEEMARAYSDTVESTGDVRTQGSEDRKGDFVVTLDGIEKRIVFEMKHRKELSLPDIRKELNESMDNRNADYAVLVSRNRSMLNQSVGWFNEYDKNKLVCALAETDDDDENAWVIDIAYRWARHRIVSANDKQLGIDPELIKQNINDIGASMNRMGAIVKQCRSITSSTATIESTLKNEEQFIRNKIDCILHSIDSTNQS